RSRAVEPGAVRPPPAVGDVRKDSSAAPPGACAARGRAARSRAAARSRSGQHAGGARRDGLSLERRAGGAARETRIPDDIHADSARSHRAVQGPAVERSDAVNARRVLAVAGVAAVAAVLVWVLFVALPRWYGPRPSQKTAAAPAAPAPPPSGRKIKARLLYVAA